MENAQKKVQQMIQKASAASEHMLSAAHTEATQIVQTAKKSQPTEDRSSLFSKRHKARDEEVVAALATSLGHEHPPHTPTTSLHAAPEADVSEEALVESRGSNLQAAASLKPKFAKMLEDAVDRALDGEYGMEEAEEEIMRPSGRALLARRDAVKDVVLQRIVADVSHDVEKRVLGRAVLAGERSLESQLRVQLTQQVLSDMGESLAPDIEGMQLTAPTITKKKPKVGKFITRGPWDQPQLARSVWHDVQHSVRLCAVPGDACAVIPCEVRVGDTATGEAQSSVNPKEAATTELMQAAEQEAADARSQILQAYDEADKERRELESGEGEVQERLQGLKQDLLLQLDGPSRSLLAAAPKVGSAPKGFVATVDRQVARKVARTAPLPLPAVGVKDDDVLVESSLVMTYEGSEDFNDVKEHGGALESWRTGQLSPEGTQLLATETKSDASLQWATEAALDASRQSNHELAAESLLAVLAATDKRCKSAGQTAQPTTDAVAVAWPCAFKTE